MTRTNIRVEGRWIEIEGGLQKLLQLSGSSIQLGKLKMLCNSYHCLPEKWEFFRDEEVPQITEITKIEKFKIEDFDLVIFIYEINKKLYAALQDYCDWAGEQRFDAWELNEKDIPELKLLHTKVDAIVAAIEKEAIDKAEKARKWAEFDEAQRIAKKKDKVLKGTLYKNIIQGKRNATAAEAIEMYENIQRCFDEHKKPKMPSAHYTVYQVQDWIKKNQQILDRAIERYCFVSPNVNG